MSKQPLVSVICLCYNHSNFVIEALNSILLQDYSAIEIIIIDDKSSDNSAQLISEWAKINPATCIVNDKNIGNTKSFNKALKLAKGDYIVDFATDDLMFPNSISEKIKLFQKTKDSKLGVVFSNLSFIDETGTFVSHQYKVDKNNNAISQPKSGSIYKDLLAHYYISAVSILIKKEVLDTLNGYDEDLAYEDLDFLLRSSRNYSYAYVDKILMKKRITKNSLGSQFFSFGSNKLSKSTYKICVKALHLNTSTEEDLALLNRLKYEIKLAAKNLDFSILFKFLQLWHKTKLSIFRRK